MLFISDRRHSSFSRRILSVLSALFILSVSLGSVAILVWSFVYYHENETPLWYAISFLIFYWPIISSAPIVCIVATIKRQFKTPDWGQKYVITWCRIFEEDGLEQQLDTGSYRSVGSTARTLVLIFFYLFVALNGLLESLWYIHKQNQCKSLALLLYLISHIVNMIFYSNFCYFLYLKRKNLEDDCQVALEYIEQNFEDPTKCVLKVKNFFREYMQLRKFVFPWLTTIVFCYAFGVTFYITWRFSLESSTINATTINLPQTLHDDIGNISRPTSCAAQDQQRYLTVFFSTLVMSERLLMVLLPVMAVGRLDLKYEWDQFKMKMYLRISPEERFWKRISELAENLHMDCSFDYITTFLIPLIGLVAGFISGYYVP